MSEKSAPQEDTEAIEGIVVGVDGSDQGLCALKWAAQEAKRRGSILNIVTAYTIPVFAASSMDAGYATLDDQLIRNGAEEVVRQARATITEEGLTVRTYIESGDPSGVLLDLSRQAELIVVGTRGRGGFVGRLLGSVSSALPAHPSAQRWLCRFASPSAPMTTRKSRTGSSWAWTVPTVPAWPCWLQPKWQLPGGCPCALSAPWPLSAAPWPGCLRRSTKRPSPRMCATK